MSDDLPLTVSRVCRRFPGARGARNVTPSTVTRWILSGCPARNGERVKLAATRCGSRWLIRQCDLNAFFEALATDPGGTTANTPPLRSPAARNKASDRAGRDLERRGA
jgi:hypothetical protein